MKAVGRFAPCLTVRQSPIYRNEQKVDEMLGVPEGSRAFRKLCNLPHGEAGYMLLHLARPQPASRKDPGQRAAVSLVAWPRWGRLQVVACREI